MTGVRPIDGTLTRDAVDPDIGRAFQTAHSLFVEIGVVDECASVEHDVNVLDLLMPESAAVYVMDRAYLDFERLFALHEAGAFFVTRAKSNADLRLAYSAPNDRTRGIGCDQIVALSGFYSRKRYPRHVRRIRFKSPQSGKNLIFLTNLFGPPPMTKREL